MPKKKIDLHMPIQEIIMTMSEGNPGALRVLMEIITSKESGLFTILHMDDMNLRGSAIWLGYKDICKEDLNIFIEKVQNRNEEMVDQINALPDMAYPPENPPSPVVVRGASF